MGLNERKAGKMHPRRTTVIINKPRSHLSRGVNALWVLSFVSFLGLRPSPAHADETSGLTFDGAEFASASGAARAVLGGGTTYFTLFLNKKRRYVSAPASKLDLGNLLVSNDGRYVTWMLSEHFYRQGFYPQGEETKKLAALRFYVDGKIIQEYTLQELLVRPDLVSESMSHTQWIMEYRNADWSPGPPSVTFAPDGSRLEFETTSLRHYVFDPRDGQMVQGDDNDLYKRSDLIVYGECEPVGAQRMRMSRYGYVKGQMPNREPIIFSNPSGSYDKGWHAVPLKKGKEGWIALEPAYKLDILYNVLPGL
jgi:hypothetical protein